MALKFMLSKPILDFTFYTYYYIKQASHCHNSLQINKHYNGYFSQEFTFLLLIRSHFHALLVSLPELITSLLELITSGSRMQCNMICVWNFTDLSRTRIITGIIPKNSVIIRVLTVLKQVYLSGMWLRHLNGSLMCNAKLASLMTTWFQILYS